MIKVVSWIETSLLEPWRRRIRCVICTEEPWLWLCSFTAREESMKWVSVLFGMSLHKVIWGQRQTERDWARFPEIMQLCIWMLAECLYKRKKGTKSRRCNINCVGGVRSQCVRGSLSMHVNREWDWHSLSLSLSPPLHHRSSGSGGPSY